MSDIEIEPVRQPEVTMTVSVRYHHGGSMPLMVERTVRFSLAGFTRLSPMQHANGSLLVVADAVTGFVAALGVTAEDMTKLRPWNPDKR